MLLMASFEALEHPFDAPQQRCFARFMEVLLHVRRGCRRGADIHLHYEIAHASRGRRMIGKVIRGALCATTSQ